MTVHEKLDKLLKGNHLYTNDLNSVESVFIQSTANNNQAQTISYTIPEDGIYLINLSGHYWTSTNKPTLKLNNIDLDHMEFYGNNNDISYFVTKEFTKGDVISSYSGYWYAGVINAVKLN